MSINYNDKNSVIAARKELLMKLRGRDDLIPVYGENIDAPIADAVRDGLKQYIDQKAMILSGEEDEYCDAFIDWEKTKHALFLKREWLCYAPTAKAAASWFLLMLTNAGDKVFTFAPCQKELRELVEGNDRSLVTHKLILSEHGYVIDFNRFEECLRTENISLVFISNPQNPTGKLWSEDELKQLTIVCRKYNVCILSDEQFQDYTWENTEHVSAVSASAFAKNVASICGGAHAFNLPDLNGCFAVIPGDELRARFKDFARRIGVTEPGVLTCIAGTAAYRYGAFWQADTKDMICSNYLMLENVLDKEYKDKLPELKYHKPEGGLQLWLDFSAYFTEAENLSYFLDDVCGVAVNNGLDYGKEYGTCAAVNIASDKESLELAVKTIAENLILLTEED